MLGTMFAKAQSSSPACGREGPTATRWEDEGNRLIGVLMVEQNIREALRIADKVYVLVGGTERFHGTVGELGDDRQLMALYMSA